MFGQNQLHAIGQLWVRLLAACTKLGDHLVRDELWRLLKQGVVILEQVVFIVVWFICWALKAKSVSVIRETNAVDFNSSMNRFPQGGIIAMNACGRMILRSAWTRVMLSAVAASH